MQNTKKGQNTMLGPFHCNPAVVVFAEGPLSFASPSFDGFAKCGGDYKNAASKYTKGDRIRERKMVYYAKILEEIQERSGQDL